jgi:uncharacterized membrane protein YdcZ (DUF606 family)
VLRHFARTFLLENLFCQFKRKRRAPGIAVGDLHLFVWFVGTVGGVIRFIKILVFDNFVHSYLVTAVVKR